MGATLDHLLEKAEAGQWSSDNTIDWSLPTKRPVWLPRAVYGQVISQLLQGEAATIQFCTELKESLPAGPARRFVTYQLADERRHALVLERYLERHGCKRRNSDTLSRMHERILVSDRPMIAKMIAYHAVLEGEAISLLQDLSNHFTCPLFSQIIRRLAVDEARHLAFGKSFLSENLEILSAEEKREVYSWVKGLWFEGAASTLQELSGMVGWVSRKRNIDLDARWARQAAVLRQIGLCGDEPAKGESDRPMANHRPWLV